MKIKNQDNGFWFARFNHIEMGLTLASGDFLSQGSAYRYLKQVHEATIKTDQDFKKCLDFGDGLISMLPEVVLAVQTADCVPVHVTDGHTIGVLHAGWRGTNAGIVRRLPEFFSHMRTVWAVIGPAIAGHHYEVDQDLYGDWLNQEPELGDYLEQRDPNSTKRYFDLPGLVMSQLRHLGIPSEQIKRIPVSTFDSPLPSYRRDGLKAGRIINYIVKRRHQNPN